MEYSYFQSNSIRDLKEIPFGELQIAQEIRLGYLVSRYNMDYEFQIIPRKPAYADFALGLSTQD